MAGLYFEDFHEGQTFEHALRRTVTEMDNVLFSTLTLNPQPLHLDEEFAKTTEFGQRIVNSLFTLGLMIGMSVGDTTLRTTIANLGMNKVEFPKPVFHGDTIRARSIVRSARCRRLGRSRGWWSSSTRHLTSAVRWWRHVCVPRSNSDPLRCASDAAVIFYYCYQWQAYLSCAIKFAPFSAGSPTTYLSQQTLTRPNLRQR